MTIYIYGARAQRRAATALKMLPRELVFTLPLHHVEIPRLRER